ncbi:SDR family NAD(P)-dependent oxidoreductase [Syntrophomonas curvata]
MINLNGRGVAITGAASGFGMGMAKRCAKMGAKLALADIDAPGLKTIETELKSEGAIVFSMVIDTAKPEQMESFAKKTFETYGDVGLFFNNAGVEIAGTTWELSAKDWQWVFGVNVLGMAYGIHSFIPRMIAEDKEALIINTSSLAGLVQGNISPIYFSGKHAVVAMTESLEIDLREKNTKIKSYVFCPRFVKTQLNTSGRNRPAELQNDPNDSYYQTADHKQKQAMMEYAVHNGIELEESIDMVFNALEQDKFYIHTAPEPWPSVQERCDKIIENRRPGEVKIDPNTQK